MAGSKKDTFETAILNLIFCNDTIANIGDTTGIRGSTADGNLYIALYSDGSVGSDSVQGGETFYTNYARVAVARTTGGWTISSGACSNAAVISFPQCGSTGDTIGGFGICSSSAIHSNTAIYWGDLTDSYQITPATTPEFNIGDIDITED